MQDLTPIFFFFSKAFLDIIEVEYFKALSILIIRGIYEIFQKDHIFYTYQFFILLSGDLNARREQNADDIAQALADRLTDALDFEDGTLYDHEIIIDITKAMETILFDAVKVNSKYVTVKKIRGEYKLVGRNNHYILAFGDDKRAARLAWLLFRTYGVERICFVGRPMFTFLRKVVKTLRIR